MRIGELAATAQCPLKHLLLRKGGLLPKASPGVNDYRLYGSNTCDGSCSYLIVVRFDMSPEEVHTLLILMDKSDRDCGSVNAVLDEHISHVDVRIGQLRRLEGPPHIPEAKMPGPK
jgi:DNA-binding transcriptional MerR regulator